MDGPQFFVMAFGAFLATAGMVLFALFLWFKGGDHAAIHKVTFLRFGVETSQPSLIIFVVGCALIVTPLFMASGNGALLLGDAPTPTPAAARSPSEDSSLAGDPVDIIAAETTPAAPDSTQEPVTVRTIVGSWQLAEESVDGFPTGRTGTLVISAVTSIEAEFELNMSTGYYFGGFEMAGDRLRGYQSDGFGLEPFEARFTYTGGRGGETLELTSEDWFGSRSRQVFQR